MFVTSRLCGRGVVREPNWRSRSRRLKVLSRKGGTRVAKAEIDLTKPTITKEQNKTVVSPTGGINQLSQEGSATPD